MQRPELLLCTCGSLAKLRFGGCQSRVNKAIVCIQRTPYYWCTGCGKKFMMDFDSIDFERSVKIAAEKIHLESTYFISTPNLVENSINKKRYVRNVDDPFWHVESGVSNG